MSAIFDTVDFGILLQRLRDSFGIRGAPLAWLISYITGLKLWFTITPDLKLQHSVVVPQGSVLGLLLFVLYTKDVISIIKRHGLDNHCYADDTQLHFSCKSKDVITLAKAFTACTDELTAWMRSNKLKLNVTKPNVSGSLLVSVGDHSQHRLLLWAVFSLVHHPEHEI